MEKKPRKQKKRSVEPADVSTTTKRPRRAAACTNFKEDPIDISEEFATVKTKKQMHVVEHEFEAFEKTKSSRINDGDGLMMPIKRRLSNFIFHDNGRVHQPIEMLEIGETILVEGFILPLDEEESKEKGVRCESFGPVQRWYISGYEEGSPVIWISTDLAEYCLCKPATRYKKMFDYFFEKAFACVAVYNSLSKNPDTSLDGLLAAVVRSTISRSKFFSSGVAVHDFVRFQGEFIYNQLVGLEASFVNNPVLVSLRSESSKVPCTMALRIDESHGMTSEEVKGTKHAILVQDEEYRKFIQPRRSKASSNGVYIKVNEVEIANDYPPPKYYESTNEEVDETLLYKHGYEVEGRDMQCKTLQNWCLYNSESRFISLELLPMQPCADIDVAMFGSGVINGDNEIGFCLDDAESSTRSHDDHVGSSIFLSQIKEWEIEFGADITFIFLRTDMAWYQLGKPSEEYAPWFEPVMKTARVGQRIFALLKNETRVAKLSYGDVIKRLCGLEENDRAYISSNLLEVERYVIVHGQIILELLTKYPDKDIKRCPFVLDLTSKMQNRYHTKWIIEEKIILQNIKNRNPRSKLKVPKMQVIPATTTRLIDRIWGDKKSPKVEDADEDHQVKEVEEIVEEVEDEDEDEDENEEEDNVVEAVEVEKSHTPMKIRGSCGKMEIRWEGGILGETCNGEPLYGQALVGGEKVAVGGAVILDVYQEETSVIYLVEYMFESLDQCKLLHGKLLQRGSKTVLEAAANERELFLTSECLTIPLEEIKGAINLEIRSRPWGHQYRKENMAADELDRARAEERKAKDLPTEYYCKSLYSPERGGFFSLPRKDMGLGSGFCSSCKIREDEEEKSKTKLNATNSGFLSNGIEYSAGDFLYVIPKYITKDGLKKVTRTEKFKYGKNIGLKAFVVCQLLDVIVLKEPRQGYNTCFEVNLRRFYRPEDISEEKAYRSDIQEIYYSEDTFVLPPEAINGKCEVRRKNYMPLCSEYPISNHIFFCELFYDSSNHSLKQLPSSIELKFSKIKDEKLLREKKGKGIEGTETDSSMVVKADEIPKEMRLATLDIFAGCGGLSYGLEKAGMYLYLVINTLSFETLEQLVFIHVHGLCPHKVSIMEKCGDLDDCVSHEEAAKLQLDENHKSALPLPGQVDFITGGPPCQGFSRMNRFADGTWSKVQCEMISAYLSFADYFRPKYFLLENVKTLISYHNGRTFKLILASLLEMGYQVRFGLLEAGAFGISQQRKRAFIWAAAPNEVLPEWPEPMHVFDNPGFKIKLSSQDLVYNAVETTKFGAPYRSMTVRDAIGDLPAVGNGESEIHRKYKDRPVSWFQKKMRENMSVLTDHICKTLNELNLIRCKKIPKRPGAHWRDLPDENVVLSNGMVEKLIPFAASNKGHDPKKYKGLYGRLAWQGNLPTSTTDPQPMGFVGMCFHPDQDRIITVRECARSQGFPDKYEFSGKIKDKHRQIGNAVPPPLAFALGRKLKEVLHLKCSLQDQS
ncbi:hypothetical protein CARUB_v10006424mg [Capsella rubella]|uniref:DNA (cytosine-5)-methyltransferase n=1 Tax=Capsella rubella TaxID=81985 RepID=R0GM97_9BRAS|nr:hypothetical protein CARUB_v10006424mg [Capsella rubella]